MKWQQQQVQLGVIDVKLDLPATNEKKRMLAHRDCLHRRLPPRDPTGKLAIHQQTKHCQPTDKHKSTTLVSQNEPQIQAIQAKTWATARRTHLTLDSRAWTACTPGNSSQRASNSAARSLGSFPVVLGQIDRLVPLLFFHQLQACF